MSEWGIPDWRSPTDYGDVSGWSENRWRWEFLRRREDYRRAFHMLAPYSYAASIKAHEEAIEMEDGYEDVPPPPINNIEFVAFPVWGEVGLFDYDGLPNPSFSEVSEELIKPIYKSPDLRLVEVEDLDSSSGERLNSNVVLPRGYVAIRFNLLEPINPQMDGLVEYLEGIAKNYRAMAHKRSRPEKWFGYLRVLDGRAAGATWSQLVDILPDWIGNRTPQAARDIHTQARRLQEAFWERRRGYAK